MWRLGARGGCCIIVISKLHRPLLTLLIRSLGKSHSGLSIVSFCSPVCLCVQSQALCTESLSGHHKIQGEQLSLQVRTRNGTEQASAQGTRGLFNCARTPGECLKILCLKNLLYCSSFNATGVCRDQGIIFDTCRKELCLH